jgi:cell wall-associated NlpC family hydrolase
MHAANKTDSVQKMSPPVVKQAAYGETRTANIKKKLMKNKISVEAAAPANAVQQSSIKTDKRAKINIARRQANRALNTDRLLAVLRRETPKFFELAEVVGKWVWIQFDGKQPPLIHISNCRREIIALTLWPFFTDSDVSETNRQTK